MGKDCSKYSCVSNSPAWQSIYSLKFEGRRRDLRVEAALARVVTRSVASIKRNLLVNTADRGCDCALQ